MHSIYALATVARPDEFLWVGATSNPRQRYINHRAARTAGTKHVRMTILQSGLLTMAERITAEVWWDAACRALGHPLRNKVGGQGGPLPGTYHHTPEARQRMSQTRKGRPTPWLEDARRAPRSGRNLGHPNYNVQGLGGVKKGTIPWNKGLRGAQVAWNKGRTQKSSGV